MKKYSILLIVVAAVIIEVIGGIQYFMARNGVEKELLVKAERDMAESQRVAAAKAEVETVVRNLLPAVQSAVQNPEDFRTLMARLVNTNPNIVGAGVAFKPNYYGDKSNAQGLYAPYAFDDRPEDELTAVRKSTPNVHYDVLGFDYTEREWYQKPMADGSSLWTQPYVDKGGTHILMCTYVMPVKVKSQIVGVFFADVPLKDVSLLSQSLHSGIGHSGLIMVVVQLISMLLLMFIIWRAVKASRRYKEEHLDSEKEQLLEQLNKLREVNHRLTERNLEMGEKIATLQRRINAGPQQSDQHWFG